MKMTIDEIRNGVKTARATNIRKIIEALDGVKDDSLIDKDDLASLTGLSPYQISEIASDERLSNYKVLVSFAGTHHNMFANKGVIKQIKKLWQTKEGK